jgi:hypothetical protein
MHLLQHKASPRCGISAGSQGIVSIHQAILLPPAAKWVARPRQHQRSPSNPRGTGSWPQAQYEVKHGQGSENALDMPI